MSFNRENILKFVAIPVAVAGVLLVSCAKPPEPAPTTPAPTQPAAPPPTTGVAKPAGDPAAGEKVFNAQGCNACHVAKGAGGQVGPKLDGLWGSKTKLTTGQEVTVDEAYTRESIVNPGAKIAAGFQPIMPASFAALPAQDLQNLIAFIASLPK